MSDDELDGKLPGGKLIPFPSGHPTDLNEIGVDYASLDSLKNITTTPQLLDLKKNEKEFREREEFVKNEDLVRSTSEEINPINIGDILIREIADELSHLKWERNQIAKSGKFASNQSVSRIAALKQLSDIITKRLENARNERLDLRSPRFQQVLTLWMNFLYESMKKVDVDDKIIELIFAQMKADMIGWESKIINSTDKL